MLAAIITPLTSTILGTVASSPEAPNNILKWPSE